MQIEIFGFQAVLELRDFRQGLLQILLGPLDFRDRMVCDEQALRGSIPKPAHAHLEPSFLSRAVASVVEVKIIAFVLNDGPDSCCRFLGLRTFLRRPIADLQIIHPDAMLRMLETIGVRKVPPVVVNSDDVSRNVQDGQIGRQRVGCRLEEPLGVQEVPMQVRIFDASRSIGGNNRYLIKLVPNESVGHLIVFEVKDSNAAVQMDDRHTNDRQRCFAMQVRIGAKAIVAACIPKNHRLTSAAHIADDFARHGIAQIQRQMPRQLDFIGVPEGQHLELNFSSILAQ